MRTLICIISAVQLGAASTGCQGEAIDASVPVHLSLDARACGIDGPGRVLFSCGVAVSVWAIDAQSGDLIADRCIEIAEPGISLEDLPQVLEGADPLTDISVASVVVGLSLSPPSDGLRCAIGSADGSGQEPGRIYAVSAPVDVGRQGAAVALELTCNEALGQIPDDGSALARCLNDCESALDACRVDCNEDTGDCEICLSEHSRCTEACYDDTGQPNPSEAGDVVDLC